MALSRLRSTERNLKKDSRVAEEYRATIQAYVEKGYLRKVPSDEQPLDNVWYLPHFPVVRMDKTTTKVRIVFDCAAKCNGISLNDMIHAGPKLQQDLFNVLVRFRRNPVDIACDIKEMYLQIEIDEQDRSHFRLLWRDLDPNREPDVFEISRVVFGKNSAPMESQFVAQENARRNQDRYPLAAETVLKSTYMDDSIDSVENDDEGVELYRQLKALWGVANMQARKWISNSPKVIEAIPTEERATEIVINSGQDPITKTLGISWNSTEDVFTVTASPLAPEFQTTKRNVLRKVATIFDPLGFVCPYVIVAKILLQELWMRGYDWDDEVQDKIANKIGAWFEQLKSLREVKIPRCLRSPEPVKSKRIVTFVDASQQAYGAAVYLRCEYYNDAVTSRLIAAKSKVAPLTPMTVPRLELMGAILECYECRRRRNKPACQIMAPLPKTRLRFTFRPFAQTAVDFAGPLYTVQGRGKPRQKRWLCLFTCLETRAVHLEMAWGLDTDTFLNAFSRFTSRRGVPKEVISDRGSNFVGAVGELKKLVSQLDRQQLQSKTAELGITWRFNPPAAPHFGGAHEVMVKAAKKAIYAAVSDRDVTDEELITVFAGAESLLNSRPLTYQSSDPRDDVPLTPNHFLHGQIGGQLAPESIEATTFHPRQRWRKVQDIISRVWRRWLKECVPALDSRPKWTSEFRDLKVGDVVIVVQPDTPRGRWPLGRIVEVYPGRDGHTRVAKVACGVKTLVRPITKLIPLEIYC